MAPPLKPAPFNLEGPDPVITSTLTLATDHLTRTLIWLSTSLQQQQDQLVALVSRVDGLEGVTPGRAHHGRHGVDGKEASAAANASASTGSGFGADASRSNAESSAESAGGAGQAAAVKPSASSGSGFAADPSRSSTDRPIDGTGGAAAANASASSSSGFAADPSRSDAERRTESAGGGGTGGASRPGSVNPGMAIVEAPGTVEEQLEDLRRRLSESDVRIRQELDSVPARVRDQVRLEVAPRLDTLEAQSQGLLPGHPNGLTVSGVTTPGGGMLGGAPGSQGSGHAAGGSDAPLNSAGSGAGLGTAGAWGQVGAAPGSGGADGQSRSSMMAGGGDTGAATNGLAGPGTLGFAGEVASGYGSVARLGSAADHSGAAGGPGGAAAGLGSAGAGPGSPGSTPGAGLSGAAGGPFGAGGVEGAGGGVAGGFRSPAALQGTGGLTGAGASSAAGVAGGGAGLGSVANGSASPAGPGSSGGAAGGLGGGGAEAGTAGAGGVTGNFGPLGAVQGGGHAGGASGLAGPGPLGAAQVAAPGHGGAAALSGSGGGLGGAGAGDTTGAAGGLARPGAPAAGVLGANGAAGGLGGAGGLRGQPLAAVHGQGVSNAAMRGDVGGHAGQAALGAAGAHGHGPNAGFGGTDGAAGLAQGPGYNRGSGSHGAAGAPSRATDNADLHTLCAALQTELHALRGEVDRLKDVSQPGTLGQPNLSGDLSAWRSEIDREVLQGRSGKPKEGDDGPSSLANVEKRLENQLMQKLAKVEAQLSQDMIARMQSVPSASATARRAGSKRPGTQSSPLGQTPGDSRAGSAGDSRSAAESLEGTSLWDDAVGAFEGRRRPGGGLEAGFSTGAGSAAGAAGGGVGGRAGAGAAGGRAGGGSGGRDSSQHPVGVFGDGGSGGSGWAAGGAAGGVATEEGGTGASGGADNMGSLLQRVGHLEACLRGLESALPGLQSLSTNTGFGRHDQSLSELSDASSGLFAGGSVSETGSPGHPGVQAGTAGAAGHHGSLGLARQGGAAGRRGPHPGPPAPGGPQGNGAAGAVGAPGAPTEAQGGSADPSALAAEYQIHGGGPWGPAGGGVAALGADLASAQSQNLNPNPNAHRQGRLQDLPIDAGPEWAAADGQARMAGGRPGAGGSGGAGGSQGGAKTATNGASEAGKAAGSAGTGRPVGPPAEAEVRPGSGAAAAIPAAAQCGASGTAVGPSLEGPGGHETSEVSRQNSATSLASGQSGSTGASSGRRTGRPFKPRQGHGQAQGGQANAGGSPPGVSTGAGGTESVAPAADSVGNGADLSAAQGTAVGAGIAPSAGNGAHPGLFSMTTTGTVMQQGTQKPEKTAQNGPNVVQGGPGYTVHLGAKPQTPPDHGPQLKELSERVGDVEKRLATTEARTRGAHWSTVQAELERYRKLFEFIEGVLPKDTAKAMRFFTEESRAPTKAEETAGPGEGAKGKKPSKDKEPYQNVLAEFDLAKHKERLQQQVDSHAADMRRELGNLMTAIKALQRDFENNRGKMDDFLRRLAGMEYEARQQHRRTGSARSSVLSQQNEVDHFVSGADHAEVLGAADERSPGSDADMKPSSSGRSPGGDGLARPDMTQQAEGEGSDQLPGYVSQKNLQSALEDLREDMKNWLDVLHGSMISSLQQKADTENLKDIVQKVTNASAVANDSIALFAKRSLIGRCASCDTPFCADPSMVKRTPPLSLERPWPARSSPGAEVMRARQDVRQLEGKSYTSLKDGHRLPKIQDKASRDLPKSKVQKNASQPELRSMRQDSHPPE